LGKPCRVGAVEFLNARPHVWGLEASPVPCQVYYDVPSVLAEKLAANQFDVALIPVAAYLDGVGGDIVPGVSIASHNAAGTIKLFARRSLGEVKSLALDRGSRSSARLARAALSALHGVKPTCVEVEPDLDRVLADADAAVVIGRADLLTGARPPEATLVVDLGELWRTWQNLPLVLAVWVFRQGWSSPEVARALQEARDRGLAEVEELARIESERFGIDPKTIAHYLTETLDLSLGPEHVESILRYRDLLLSEGLLAQRRELSFAE
jgi:chorismate dehydratase